MVAACRPHTETHPESAGVQTCLADRRLFMGFKDAGAPQLPTLPSRKEQQGNSEATSDITPRVVSGEAEKGASVCSDYRELGSVAVQNDKKLLLLCDGGESLIPIGTTHSARLSHTCSATMPL